MTRDPRDSWMSGGMPRVRRSGATWDGEPAAVPARSPARGLYKTSAWTVPEDEAETVGSYASGLNACPDCDAEAMRALVSGPFQWLMVAPGLGRVLPVRVCDRDLLNSQVSVDSQTAKVSSLDAGGIISSHNERCALHEREFIKRMAALQEESDSQRLEEGTAVGWCWCRVKRFFKTTVPWASGKASFLLFWCCVAYLGLVHWNPPQFVLDNTVFGRHHVDSFDVTIPRLMFFAIYIAYDWLWLYGRKTLHSVVPLIRSAEARENIRGQTLRIALLCQMVGLTCIAGYVWQMTQVAGQDGTRLGALDIVEIACFTVFMSGAMAPMAFLCLLAETARWRATFLTRPLTLRVKSSPKRQSRRSSIASGTWRNKERMERLAAVPSEDKAIAVNVLAGGDDILGGLRPADELGAHELSTVMHDDRLRRPGPWSEASTPASGVAPRVEDAIDASDEGAAGLAEERKPGEQKPNPDSGQGAVLVAHASFTGDEGFDEAVNAAAAAMGPGDSIQQALPARESDKTSCPRPQKLATGDDTSVDMDAFDDSASLRSQMVVDVGNQVAPVVLARLLGALKLRAALERISDQVTFLVAWLLGSFSIIGFVCIVNSLFAAGNSAVVPLDGSNSGAGSQLSADAAYAIRASFEWGVTYLVLFFTVLGVLARLSSATSKVVPRLMNMVSDNPHARTIMRSNFDSKSARGTLMRHQHQS